MGVDFILVTHLLLRWSLLASTQSTENSGTLWPSFQEVVFLAVLFRGNRSWTSSWKLETWSSEVLDERGIFSPQRWKTRHCRPIHPWKYSLRLVPRTILVGLKQKNKSIWIRWNFCWSCIQSSRKIKHHLTPPPPPPFFFKTPPLCFFKKKPPPPPPPLFGGVRGGLWILIQPSSFLTSLSMTY